jgi:hypothetical protein
MKPTREEAKKHLKALDNMEDWLEANIDALIPEADDDPDSIPIEFDREKLSDNFESIRSALRFCL